MKRSTHFVTACVAVLAVSAGPAFAEPSCKPVVGHFEASVVPAAECPSFFCTAGRVWGGVQGTYEFVMSTLQPSGAVASISFFTGNSTISLKSGDQVLRGELSREDGTTSGDYIGTLCTP